MTPPAQRLEQKRRWQEQVAAGVSKRSIAQADGVHRSTVQRRLKAPDPAVPRSELPAPSPGDTGTGAAPDKRVGQKRRWQALADDGHSIRSIAKAEGLAPSTVLRRLKAPDPDPLKPGRIPRAATGFRRDKPPPERDRIMQAPHLKMSSYPHLLYLRAAVLAAAGFSCTETCWLLDTTRASVARARRRMGFDWKTPDMDAELGDAARVGRDAEFTEAALRTAGDVNALYELIGDMKPAQAIEHLVGVINGLLWAPERQSRTPAPGLTLTDREARALHMLDRRRGTIVPYGNLVAAVYAEVPEDQRPDPENIKTIVMTLRRKLTQAGIAAEIANAWGAGYRLVADRGTFDWTI